MSQVHAMSDEQVSGELKKMTAFIRQEALEKANEIQFKADEEFAIEKSKLVRQETASIDSAYEKKFKQASMSQQITRSTVANKTRLRILNERQVLLNSLFKTAEEKLKDVGSNKAKYQAMLKNLILEGAYALNEDKLQVRARKADYDLVKKAIEEAQKEYKSSVGKDVQLSIDEKDPLPEGSAGGVALSGTGGKIALNNTFEERLKLLEDEALPSIRVTLFGDNQNRKFHD
ncbi:ATPase, V1/A1 complex, subunit E [Melanomma pulvis-pyrius CBS 109.77]|uniref:ATPase, V1/A1 complex, subunit E n=1 Tax=Melanomma pulvis-pyrius CBS 109.77 TaxID=1314802 RepID=A0A6A6X5A9_9PLEO|nr:ATPase, V1/A1 complex, subunit E [Melanomma pulvis-pyrius CBS 109.77]